MDMSLIINDKAKAVPVLSLGSTDGVATYPLKVKDTTGLLLVDLDTPIIFIDLASNVSITDAISHSYKFSVATGLDYNNIARFRRWQISFFHTHNAPVTVTLNTYCRALRQTSGAVVMYTSAGFMPAGNTKKIITSIDAGAGSSGIISVPLLDGIHGDIEVVIQYATPPTSGFITIAVEAQK